MHLHHFIDEIPRLESIDYFGDVGLYSKGYRVLCWRGGEHGVGTSFTAPGQRPPPLFPLALPGYPVPVPVMERSPLLRADRDMERQKLVD